MSLCCLIRIIDQSCCLGDRRSLTTVLMKWWSVQDSDVIYQVLMSSFLTSRPKIRSKVWLAAWVGPEMTCESPREASGEMSFGAFALWPCHPGRFLHVYQQVWGIWPPLPTRHQWAFSLWFFSLWWSVNEHKNLLAFALVSTVRWMNSKEIVFPETSLLHLLFAEKMNAVGPAILSCLGLIYHASRGRQGVPAPGFWYHPAQYLECSLYPVLHHWWGQILFVYQWQILFWSV